MVFPISNCELDYTLAATDTISFDFGNFLSIIGEKADPIVAFAAVLAHEAVHRIQCKNNIIDFNNLYDIVQFEIEAWFMQCSIDGKILQIQAILVYK